MRRKLQRRESPLVYAAVGASLLTIPASAAALTSSPTRADAGKAARARAKRRKVHRRHDPHRAHYRRSIASWYDDSGSTACGFHAYYGVANKTLPCGTSVTFRYHGRTVRAVVDDRGPFVSGRSWDLNQNTAAALDFGGVDAVWSSR